MDSGALLEVYCTNCTRIVERARLPDAERGSKAAYHYDELREVAQVSNSAGLSIRYVARTANQKCTVLHARPSSSAMRWPDLCTTLRARPSICRATLASRPGNQRLRKKVHPSSSRSFTVSSTSALDLPAKNAPHVAVIGCGLVGLSSAYELSLSGYRITLIDREDHVANECSHANAALIMRAYSRPKTMDFLQLLRWMSSKSEPVH
eukprot:1412406-Pleurochrysis_carterae.AAC.1